MTNSSGSTGTDNALRHNIETKGNNAYYYAHNRKFEVPENAIVRESGEARSFPARGPAHPRLPAIVSESRW